MWKSLLITRIFLTLQESFDRIVTIEGLQELTEYTFFVTFSNHYSELQGSEDTLSEPVSFRTLSAGKLNWFEGVSSSCILNWWSYKLHYSVKTFWSKGPPLFCFPFNLISIYLCLFLSALPSYSYNFFIDQELIFLSSVFFSVIVTNAQILSLCLHFPN